MTATMFKCQIVIDPDVDEPKNKLRCPGANSMKAFIQGLKRPSVTRRLITFWYQGFRYTFKTPVNMVEFIDELDNYRQDFEDNKIDYKKYRASLAAMKPFELELTSDDLITKEVPESNAGIQVVGKVRKRSSAPKTPRSLREVVRAA